MVGATLACALAKGGLRIGIVEAYEPRPFDSENDYELRVSAISPGSEKVLAALQVWPLIQQSRLCAYRQMHVWDAAGWGEIHFDAAEIGASHLGHIIENHVIQGALVERLRSFENITIVLSRLCASNRCRSRFGGSGIGQGCSPGMPS